MSEEDIELVAQECGFDSKQKVAFQIILHDCNITNLDDLYSQEINLDRLSIRLYSKCKPHTVAGVIYKLAEREMISKVLDKDGNIPKEKILSQVNAYFERKLEEPDR